MKKVLLLLFALLFLLCGCKGATKQSSFKLEKTTANVAFAEGETMIKGELEFFSPEKITLKLAEPKDAEGFVLKLENGAMSLGFEGTECSLESAERIFGSSKGFQTLFEVLSAAGESETKLSARKGKLSCALGEAVLSLDEEEKLKSIRCAVYDYEFTFVQDMA